MKTKIFSVLWTLLELIKKQVHYHTLRHSCATHLIEQGYALAYLQILLGHASMETTSGYVHLASPTVIKTRSPYGLLKSVSEAQK